jgi:hypothetical protein
MPHRITATLLRAGHAIQVHSFLAREECALLGRRGKSVIDLGAPRASFAGKESESA